MADRAAIAFADTCNIGIADRNGMKELLSAGSCFFDGALGYHEARTCSKK